MAHIIWDKDDDVQLSQDENVRNEVQDGAVRGRQITEILWSLQDDNGEEFDVLGRPGLSSEYWFLIGSDYQSYVDWATNQNQAHSKRLIS